MRHDWNSLLSDVSHTSPVGTQSSTDASLTVSSATASGWLLFKNYSSDYYPHASALVQYLRDWASGGRVSPDQPNRHPATPLRVRYGTAVAEVRILTRDGANAHTGPLPPRFRLSLTDGSALTCTFLILATGLQVRE